MARVKCKNALNFELRVCDIQFPRWTVKVNKKKTLVRVQSGSGLLMFVKKTFVQFSNSKRQTDSFVYYWWNTKLSYTDIEERERAERVKILKFSVSFIYSFNFQCLAVVFFVHTLKIGCHKKIYICKDHRGAL